jgi:hypothetical protein
MELEKGLIRKCNLPRLLGTCVRLKPAYFLSVVHRPLSSGSTCYLHQTLPTFSILYFYTRPLLTSLGRVTKIYSLCVDAAAVHVPCIHPPTYPWKRAFLLLKNRRLVHTPKDNILYTSFLSFPILFQYHTILSFFTPHS